MGVNAPAVQIQLLQLTPIAVGMEGVANDTLLPGARNEYRIPGSGCTPDRWAFCWLVGGKQMPIGLSVIVLGLACHLDLPPYGF